MTNEVSFYLNGKLVHLDNPSPDLLLIDYLRSPDVALAGPKKPCGQGGCGGCTVILSHWDGEQAQHRAINSCLRPVCALGGQVVTTVEGTGAARRPNPEFLLHAATASRGGAPIGQQATPAMVEAVQQVQDKRAAVASSVADALKEQAGKTGASVALKEVVAQHPSQAEHDGMNPVAHRLALNNGSQCGYCSVGFVMNMSEFIVNNPQATKKEIEDCFDGNICRCTGYRAILTGMKTFASDWSAADEARRMICLEDDGCAGQRPSAVSIPFPKRAQGPAQPVSAHGGGQLWRTPATLAELAKLMAAHRDRKLRLVHGNTSFGIYKEEFPHTKMFVDIRLIPELNETSRIENGKLRVASGTSYNDLIALLGVQMAAHAGGDTSTLGALQFMARRTAGRIVRNAASVGGNTMLVLSHIADHSGEPFPSDALTALAAIGAHIAYLELDTTGHLQPKQHSVDELVRLVQAAPGLAHNIVLTAFLLPLPDANIVVLAQKVALRDVNAHSIVNASTALHFGEGATVKQAALVFGGIAPFPWHAAATEALLANKVLALADVATLSLTLERETRAELARWKARMQGLPDEGFSDDYRVELVLAFFYKAVVNALPQRGVAVPPQVASSGEITWGKWPVSDGIQSWQSQDFKRPVAQPYIKITAMYQTSGQLHYTQELAVPPRTLNAAFVQSTRALGNFHFRVPGHAGPATPGQLREHLSGHDASFVDLITQEHIKNGGLNLQGMGMDQPLLAVQLISYVGQSIALVLAETEQEAIRIAEYVSSTCIGYTDVDWPAPFNKPIIELEDAIAADSVFPDSPQSASYVAHIWKITRPGSNFDWASSKAPLDRAIVQRDANISGANCLVLESTQRNGGQVHFYMETQACIAEPQDQGRIMIRPSTQSPMEMHQTTAMALGVAYHQVDVKVAPVGGAFGGKTEPARFVVGPVAVAARAVKRPVRLAMPRDQDTSMIGKRHACYGQYQIALDRGEGRPQDKGIMRGFQTKMWADGGAFYDCSYIVSNCIQLRADNAYRVANFENQIDVCRTNTAPSTAFRAFGDVQAKNILENAVDDAAFALGMSAEDVREKNLYERGDVTPFGQALSYCYIRQVWDFLKDKCKYEEKKAAVDDFNSKNKWRKRGLAMVPVKYGSGYNWQQLEQAAAIVVVNQADGTLIIHQGGVEMGQGLATQVLQVAAYVMNIPMDLIHVEGPRTSITPNPTSSGASTGTPYNCEVVKQTCQDLRGRLLEFGYQMRNEQGDAWCTGMGIDFWNFPDGWATSVTINKRVSLIWQNLIQLAYAKRVNLIASFTARIKGGGVPIPAMTFKPQDLQPNPPGIPRDTTAVLGGGVDSFVGFTYSAACAVSEVDVLTGEVKIISADIVYDIGWSLNPAIDVGQVEGAFVQGIGYLLTEKLVFEPEGADQGRLNTTNTWRYKVPAASTIPLEMNVHLFPRNLPSVQGIPDDPHDIFSSKEVGEPPLVLANSVFFAVKAAVRASRLERGLDGLFRMDAPATVQEVRRACEVSTAQLG
ncbi:molybdopterin-dependent oxidoreductase [Oxalobacteraceae bacterium]|nr:molybdopterin-dependent oxidoreductase [Oxalobacteraceae bacterium]